VVPWAQLRRRWRQRSWAQHHQQRRLLPARGALVLARRLLLLLLLLLLALQRWPQCGPALPAWLGARPRRQTQAQTQRRQLSASSH
jgi:hypothetical protein